MERWRVCPDCGSTNIHCDLGVTPRVASNESRAIANMLVYDGGPWGGKVASVDTFVCIDCGYIRSYVSSNQILDQIKDKWPRADSLAPDEDANVTWVADTAESTPGDEEYG